MYEGLGMLPRPLNLSPGGSMRILSVEGAVSTLQKDLAERGIPNRHCRYVPASFYGTTRLDLYVEDRHYKNAVEYCRGYQLTIISKES